MARATVFRYKGQDVDPQKAGRDLRVEAVVMGKVTQRGDTLSIKAELVDVATGRQIWGEHYTRKFSDVFAIQESISTEISRKLRSTANRQTIHGQRGGVSALFEGALPLEQEIARRGQESHRIL